MKQFFLYIPFILGLSMTLSGCGIKPTSVDAPPGKENQTFPNIYPAPDKK